MNRTKTFPSFTKTEIDRHKQYLSFFKYTEGIAYLESGRSITPLFNYQNYSKKEGITVGPILPGKQTFFTKNGLSTSYQHTGGYTYAFEDNIVYKLNAEKLIPERLFNNSFKPKTNINDLAMTKQKFIESDYVPNKWHTRSVNLVNHVTHIKFLLPEEEVASGFGVTLPISR